MVISFKKLLHIMVYSLLFEDDGRVSHIRNNVVVFRILGYCIIRNVDEDISVRFESSTSSCRCSGAGNFIRLYEADVFFFKASIHYSKDSLRFLWIQ